MKNSTKFLLLFLSLGLLYSFIRLILGSGGNGLYDFLNGLGVTSILLFIISLIVISINFRHLKKHLDTFLFLLLGLPMTVFATIGFIEYFHNNRTPDLTAKYERPVNQTQYFQDSTNIKIAIDSLIALHNRNERVPKIQCAVIDTIIYSQTGEQIFISYARIYMTNNLGNVCDPWYLSAKIRNNNNWLLRDGPPNAKNMSGSFHDLPSLKREVRKFYFNQYCFLDKDSLKENYFWMSKKN